MSAAAHRGRMWLLLGGLLAFNGLAWLWTGAAFHARSGLFGMAVLAYSFGLRHAVDADHIAAIDNVTRKLMQAGQRPIASGLYFSLGHAAVVLVASMLLAGATHATRSYLGQYRDAVAELGSAVSIVLLLLVALVNGSILTATLRARRRLKGAGAASLAPGADWPAAAGGLLARACRPLFKLITRSWHTCLLGLLFGLGFDTATEIGVLGLSAAQAAQGLSLWAILAFPLLFAAGMSLVDTLDSTLMVGAYGWAFVDPVHKLSYNITVLAVSVAVALGVGGAEALGLLAVRTKSSGPVGSALAALNEHMGTAGCLIILILLACWLISLALQGTRGTLTAR